MQLMGKETAINLSKLDFKFDCLAVVFYKVHPINLSKLDFKFMIFPNLTNIM